MAFSFLINCFKKNGSLTKVKNYKCFSPEGFVFSVSGFSCVYVTNVKYELIHFLHIRFQQNCKDGAMKMLSPKINSSRKLYIF